MLAVDIGNRITRFGLFYKGSLEATWSITTQVQATSDEAKLAIMNFFVYLESEQCRGEVDMASLAWTDSILSCSVPSLTGIWSAALQALSGKRPLVVGPGLKTGLSMKYNDPSEIGPDRIADSIAAIALYGYPLIIIDCGMTVNYVVIDADGAFAGGLITLGISSSARALSQAAARLPVIDIARPKSLIGKSTRESVQSGIIMGEVARINGLISLIWQDLGYETAIVLAGEDAPLLAPLLTPLLGRDVIVDDDLTLQGLRLLYERNRG